MKRLGFALAIVLGVFAATTVHAKPEYLEKFLSAYQPYAKALEARSCASCHVSESDYGLNPYGKQIAQKKIASGQKGLSVAILRQVEPLDADGDGVSNLEEIKASTNPGDAKSNGSTSGSTTTKPPTKITNESHNVEHTENVEHMETEEGEVSQRGQAVEPKPLLPKNAFHPAVVHFPIALFIAGLLLDLIGLWRNQKTLLFAGWYNLVLAAVSGVVAVLTGFVSLFLLRIPLTGIMRNHMLLAIGAAFIMWMMVALRVYRHEQMNIPIRILYAALAVAGLAMIAYAGHLGGVFVYGE